MSRRPTGASALRRRVHGRRSRGLGAPRCVSASSVHHASLVRAPRPPTWSRRSHACVRAPAQGARQGVVRPRRPRVRPRSPRMPYASRARAAPPRMRRPLVRSDPPGPTVEWRRSRERGIALRKPASLSGYNARAMRVTREHAPITRTARPPGGLGSTTLRRPGEPRPRRPVEHASSPGGEPLPRSAREHHPQEARGAPPQEAGEQASSPGGEPRPRRPGEHHPRSPGERTPQEPRRAPPAEPGRAERFTGHASRTPLSRAGGVRSDSPVPPAGRPPSPAGGVPSESPSRRAGQPLSRSAGPLFRRASGSPWPGRCRC